MLHVQQPLLAVRPSLITLERVILHVVGDAVLATPFSSQEMPAPPVTDQTVWDYLRGHIEAALADEHLRPATFADPTPTAARECARVLAGGRDMVEASRALAERLDAIVKANHSIAPGDLAVCLYRLAAAESHGARDLTQGTRLALLKLDFGKAFRHRLATGTVGKYVTLEPVPGRFVPQLGRPLQKCAFLRPLEPRARDFDALLLDRQAPLGGNVARFFHERFLGLELAFTDFDLTKRFYELTTVAGQVAVESVTPQDRAAVSQAFSDATARALAGASIDVEQFVAGLRVPEAARILVQRKLAAMPQKVITVDPAFSARRQVFTGDFGLKVEFPPAFSKGNWKVEFVAKPKDLGPAYHQITIKTTKWLPA
jgi:hypothetical protein